MHSNGQLRAERDGDTEKGCHKPAVQQKTTDDDPFSDCDNEFHQSSLLIICARV